MDAQSLKEFLDSKVDQYNRPSFIENDPIVIPHKFSLKQDVEIMGFFAAMLAWGQRKTIINKCNELIDRMGGEPYKFVLKHSDDGLKRLLGFKHRTFNDTDLLYFVSFFHEHYQEFDSLEDAFMPQVAKNKNSEFRNDFLIGDTFSAAQELSSPACFAHELNQPQKTTEENLNYFRRYFFSQPDFPSRTIKHVSSPVQKSTCKRLNMFLRWMVRRDDKGVDFGIWNRISPAQLICPCDVHVERVARRFGLIARKQVDWQTALELTERLREFDPADPVKYDFALFGLGVEGEF